MIIAGCDKDNVNSNDEIETTGLNCFSDDFESGALANGWSKELPNDDALAIMTSPLGSGKCMRFELNYFDRVGSYCRSELRLSPQPQLGENWFGFSIFIPANYEPDSQYKEEIVAQWHNIPDEDIGEEWGCPPLMLKLREDGNWWLCRYWDANRLTSTNTSSGEPIDMGSYLNDRGQWIDWVFHIKWGWRSSHNTILEVYKNGLLVLERNGMPNTTNDRNGPYFKLGIYKPSWINATTAPIIMKRVIYHDNVKIMDSSASLADFNN